MRPITLTFNGCRSYVEPQTVDFTGKQFVAIVGDTGSGKSTVLDAICYGLYNRCSWHGGTISDLVAHGGDGTLSVELTFEVAGNTWRVERSTTPRTAAPAHKLVSVDTDTVVATGANAVTAHIRRITGLDYDTFLRAVILPQGRFHELLRMGDSDRSKILKSVLGLDQLTAVRGHAQTLHTRLALRLSEYRERRALFLPDPEQLLVDATERQRVAQERLDLLQAAQGAVAVAQTAVSKAAERAKGLEKARDRLTCAIPDRPKARYQAILAAATDNTGRQQDVERRREAALGKQKVIQGELDDADLQGTGIAKVASAISTLRGLASQVPQLDDQAARLLHEEQEIQAAFVDLEGKPTALAGLAKSVGAAEKALTGARSRLRAAEEAHAAARDAVTTYREAAEHAKEADELVAGRGCDVADLKAAVDSAAAEAKLAAEVLEQREAEQARTVQKHAAAVASGACSPGDPCPVCNRALPDDFTAPPDEATKTVDAAVRAARKVATEAGDKATAAAERARISEQETLAAAKRDAADAAADLSRAKAHGYELLGEFDVDTPNDDLLRPFNDVVTTRTVEHGDADKAFRDAETTHRQAASELPLRRQALAERKASHDVATTSHATAVATLRDTARNLPPAFRLADDLSVEEINLVRGRAEHRQEELAQLTGRLSTISETLGELDAEQQQLEDELAERVTGPASTIRRHLDQLIDRAGDAEALVKRPSHPPRPTESSLADEAAWCTAMLNHTAQLVTACNQEAEAARLAAAAASDTAEQARRDCGAEDDKHLEQLVRKASTGAHNASRDIAKATTHKPLAEELQRRIDTAAPAVAALGELVTLLADGKFVAEAVRQRQHALLSAASQTLLTISGGRFGFASNFLIIDTDTAQPRDVRTLSGGETFQASLALALAVVELASRASGRVDSLFLDEGFGSLDSEMLREALTALATHSTAGRLVTLISHMRSIAENVDHVLVVKRTFAGSQAHWAIAEEREQIINDDLGRGQLT
jgi:exonuclease SbcC